MDLDMCVWVLRGSLIIKQDVLNYLSILMTALKEVLYLLQFKMYAMDLLIKGAFNLKS